MKLEWKGQWERKREGESGRQCELRSELASLGEGGLAWVDGRMSKRGTQEATGKLALVDA